MIPRSASNEWMFHRSYQVFNDEKSARVYAKDLIKKLEYKGYFHFRNYANENCSSDKRIDIYSRTRWALKSSERNEDGPRMCYEIFIMPVDECFDVKDNKWSDPSWLFYNHVADDWRFVYDDIDAKLLVGSAAMENSHDYGDFKVLDMEWTESVNMAFQTIDSKSVGLVSNGDVVLSLFPLKNK